MHNDLVSIIMPMHNSAKYVGEAIQSVVNQTYENWELLVIDDASTDNSCDIVREYVEQDHRVHLLFNDNHTGHLLTKKSGREVCQGKIYSVPR